MQPKCIAKQNSNLYKLQNKIATKKGCYFVFVVLSYILKEGEIMKCAALMTDIVESKKINKKSREELQIFIKKVIESLNEVFEPSIKFNVVFSAGDEVQGLFKNPLSAYLYYRLLKFLAFPLEIRCGIGVGTWDVRIPGGTSSEQDGTVYHNARKAIELSNRLQQSFNIVINSEDDKDLYINTLINSISLINGMQSEHQRQVMVMIELIQPLYSEVSMNLQKLYELLKLIKEKEKLIYYKENNKKNIFNNIDNLGIRFEPYDLNSKLKTENILKKGTAEKISEIINTSRQNADKIIKTGNIAWIRNMEITALIYMAENYGGD